MGQFIYKNLGWIICALAINTTAVSAQNTLTGRVLDEHDQPLAGAVIELAPSHQTTISLPDGSFILENVAASDTQFFVQYLGYNTHYQVFMPIHNTTLALQSIRLTAAPQLIEAILIEHNQHSSLHSTQVGRNFFLQNMQGTFAKSLENLAGVQAINVGVGVAKPVIRGMAGNRIIVQNDGIKQEGQQWGNDHGLEIDAFDIEEVTLIKGANSLQYGSDGLGGVLIIKPTGALPTQTLSGSVLGIYKTNNQHVGTSANLAWRNQHWWSEARYTFQQFSDYQVPANNFTYNGYTLPLYNNRLKNTAGIEQNGRISVGYQHLKGISRLSLSAYTMETGLFMGAVGIPRAYSLQPDNSNRDRSLPSQGVRHYKLAHHTAWDITPAMHITADIGYQYNLRQEFSFPEIHNRPRPTVNPSLALQLDLQTLSANISLECTQCSHWRHTYGIQAQHQINKASGFEFLLPNYRTWQAGGYWVFNWRPNTRTTWNGGLRLDAAQLQSDDFQQLIYAADRSLTYQSRAQALARQFLNYSASLGWAYRRGSSWLWRANFGKTFRVPTPNELVANGVHHGTFRHELGTRDLRAEQGYQLDLSSDFVYKKLTIKASTFANYFQDYIYLRPTGQFSPLPEGGQMYQYSQTNAIFAGGECALTWEITRHLHLRQAYEYVYNVNLQTSLGLPFTPPANVLSELSYTLDNWKYFNNTILKITHNYTFAQNRTDRNERKTPAFQLLDVAINTQIRLGNQTIQLGIQVQNALNTPYLQHLSRYRLLNLPEQGRNIVGTIRLPFGMDFKTKKG